MDLVYRTVIGLIVVVFRLMGWRITVSGTEHLPARGPAVIASNHIGYLDFTFVGYAARPAGRLVRFMAKKEVFDHPVAGPLMRAMRHVPVDRFGTPREALDTAVRVLDEGQVIGMFPEGTISRSFVPARAKSGAARMAMEAGAPLIPAAVWGSQRILTKGRPRNLERNVAITVVFGAPIAYAPGDDATEVTDRLMASIEQMVADAARTYPQEPAGPSDRWWLPSHLGGDAPSVDEAERAAAAESAERRARRRAERREQRDAS